MAAISPSHLLPLAIVTLSLPSYTICSSDQVSVDEAFTFIIMDHGETRCLSYPLTAPLIGSKVADLPLYDLLILLGGPANGGSVIPTLSAKILDVVWSVCEFDLWRCAQAATQSFLSGARAYYACLHMVTRL